jgi:hypothetical protein
MCLSAGRAEAENEDLEEGIRLYEALEYEPAQAKLETALANERSSRADIARAALYLGVVRVALGDPSEGTTWFTVALSYEASAEIPPGTSPKIREQFEAIAAKLTFARTSHSAASTDKPKLDAPPSPGIDALADDTPAPVTKAEEGSMMWTYAAGGATILSAGAALTFGILAYGTANDIESRPHERAELASLQDDLDFQGRLGNAFLAATGALAATTAVVYLVQRPGKKRLETPPVTVSGTSNGAMVGTWFRF